MRYIDGEPVVVEAYALVEGVIYTGCTAIGVGVPRWQAFMNDVREVGTINAVSRLYLPVTTTTG